MCVNMNGNLVKSIGDPEFLSSVCKNDIVLLSECWTNEMNEPQLRINGYVDPLCKHRVKNVELSVIQGD